MTKTIVLAVVGAIVLVIAAATCGAYGGMYLCREAGKAMGRPTKYEAAECFVQQRNGQWVPKDAYRVENER